MSTSIRATLLGLTLIPLSIFGTLQVLNLFLQQSDRNQPTLEVILFLLVALLPALLFAGIAALQSIQEQYKKAIALGLLVPTLSVCVWYGIGISW